MALYRKKRPATFDEVVGQDHVKEVLKNAIKKDRLAHAYLFSGPRGVGKTTMARILAMATGCAAGPEERPCGVCEHCRMVREGRHPDVLEVDAASNNSVEDVRELKEQILLAPVLAPKKVIILDEAHMMSKSAFNALLKTLEEPPEHVLFIFATTEPERMPATVKSRTQHFRFQRIPESEITKRLLAVAEEEGVELDEKAARLLARASEGALRDALTLLERLFVLGRRIEKKDVEELLGIPPEEANRRLLAALFSPDPEKALAEANSLFAAGYAPRTILNSLKELLKEELVKSPGEEKLAALLALDEAEERLAREEGMLPLEIALLKAHRLLAPSAKKPAPAPEPAAKPPPSPEKEAKDPWQELLTLLPAPVRAVVREARPQLKGQTLVLVYPARLKFHIQRARAERAKIKAAASQAYGASEVEISVTDGEEEEEPETPEAPAPPPPPPEKKGILDDPRLKLVKRVFAAEVVDYEERDRG